MYKEMYLVLFHAIQDALEEFLSEPAREILIRAQQEAEEIYMEFGK